MRKRRGLTLLELLIAIGMATIIFVAVSGSVISAFEWQRRQPEIKEARDRVVRFPDRMRSLLQSAYLPADAEDPVGIFLGDNSSGSGEFADQVVFTAIGAPSSGAYLNSPDDEEFENLNARFGTQGGLVEVGISSVPVGTSPYDAGLYLREQRPADGDPTQGGFESMLDEAIQAIQFEFFDGTEWIGTWDTRTEGRRLPAAVRVTYQLGEEGTDRVFIVRLPHSDVTPENPITQEAEGGQATP